MTHFVSVLQFNLLCDYIVLLHESSFSPTLFISWVVNPRFCFCFQSLVHVSQKISSMESSLPQTTLALPNYSPTETRPKAYAWSKHRKLWTASRYFIRFSTQKYFCCLGKALVNVTLSVLHGFIFWGYIMVSEVPSQSTRWHCNLYETMFFSL